MADHLRDLVRKTGRRSAGAIVAAVDAGGERTVAAWAPRGVAAGGDTVFEIGSVTKPFTAVLLAEMVARGEVALDNPLAEHLPAARDLGLADVTLEQLATHRSGLPNAPGPMFAREVAMLGGLQRANPWIGVDEARYHELVRAARRTGGGKVRYSSVGFGLLGDALAARAGAPYGELLRERVLAPLGLTSTGVDVPPTLPGVSRRGRPKPELIDPMPAAGAVRSTASDLLRFLAACREPSAVGGPLGEALALTQQPRAKVRKGAAFGLGWIVLDGKGEPRVVWHNGGTYGFRSFVGFAPERGVSVAVLTNVARDVTHLGHRLLREALQDA
ncbi:MAG TPA: serine hydrolase domain-containing protein [Capillimicrobium sp.]|jgi:CubicO group peptidase (beta-lactamase class C family)